MMIEHEGRRYEVVGWRLPTEGELYLSQDGTQVVMSVCNPNIQRIILRPVDAPPERRQDHEARRLARFAVGMEYWRDAYRLGRKFAKGGA